MIKAKKILALLLCTVLLVGASVAGTVAYLTSRDEVVNTFTIGKITITLQEYDVDPQTGLKKTGADGKPIEVASLQNLELVPGREIQKHPFITIAEGSEPCWLFVKVENGLEEYEAEGDTTIAEQLRENGWITLEEGVYYYGEIIPTSTTAQVYTVFETIKISNDAQAVAGWGDIATNGDVVITAYAIQSEGFNAKDTAAENAADAWAALNPQS